MASRDFCKYAKQLLQMQSEADLPVSVFRMVRHRVIWLLVLVIVATLTVNVLNHFEQALEAVVALALFIPFLIIYFLVAKAILNL